MESAAGPVQRQLDAYNARDIDRFVAEYTEDVRVFRPPSPDPVIVGKPALRDHYSRHRFGLPLLHARLLSRIVSGDTVVDHEEVTGVQDGVLATIAVYRVRGGLIEAVWFF